MAITGNKWQETERNGKIDKKNSKKRQEMARNGKKQKETARNNKKR